MYKIKVALQKIRWLSIGQIDLRDYNIFFSGTENLHNFGSNFLLRMTRYIKEFNPVSERIFSLHLSQTRLTRL